MRPLDKKEMKYIVVGTSVETGIGLTVAHSLVDFVSTTAPVVVMDIESLAKTELRSKNFEIAAHPTLPPIFFPDEKPPHKGARFGRIGKGDGNGRYFIINKNKKKQSRKARKQTRKVR